MDIYEYLKMDHKHVAKLFKLYENSPTRRNELEIFAMIKKELTVHAVSEQETFYAALENYPESRPDTLHAEKEHADILDRLEEITNEITIKANIKMKMIALRKIVEHHVSEEEGKIFKIAKKVLSEEEAMNLKFKMHDYKEKILNNLLITEKELA